MQQKILILAANPKGTTPLRLDEEVREIDAGLKRARNREQFVLEQKWAVRPRDIQRAMLDINPQIIHFSGHGTEDDFIYGSSDSSFAINLINHLKNVGNTEAICQLCCKELSHILKGNSEYFLKRIAVKLNCNYHLGQNSPNNKQQAVPSSSYAPSVSVNPSNQLVKSIIAGGTILLIGLAGFGLYNQNKNSSSPSTQTASPTPITPSTLDPEYPITSPIETQQPKASTAPIILLYGYKTDPSLFNKIQNSVGYPIKYSFIYNDRQYWFATKPTVIYSDDNFKNFASQLAENLTNSTGVPFVTQYVSPENRVEHQSVRWDISIHIAGV